MYASQLGSRVVDRGYLWFTWGFTWFVCDVHVVLCTWRVVRRLPWLPLQLGAPGSLWARLLARGFVPVLVLYRRGLCRLTWTPSLLCLSCTSGWGKDDSRAAACVCGCAVACSALVVGGTDTSSRHWSPASPFPVPHSREPGPGSPEVSGMGLWPCGPQVVVFSWSPQLLDLFTWSGSWTFRPWLRDWEVVLVLCCPGWILAWSASSPFLCGGVVPFRLVLCYSSWFVSLWLVVEVWPARGVPWCCHSCDWVVVCVTRRLRFHL